MKSPHNLPNSEKNSRFEFKITKIEDNSRKNCWNIRTKFSKISRFAQKSWKLGKEKKIPISLKPLKPFFAWGKKLWTTYFAYAFSSSAAQNSDGSVEWR